MKKQLIIRIILGVLAFSMGQTAWAFTYKVELLVFAQYLPNTEQFEQTASAIQWPADMLEIAAPAIASQNSVTMLPLSGLASVNARLVQNKSYTVLFQTAWLQTINNNQAGQPVHFSNPNNTINGFIKITAGAALNVQVDAEYSPVKVSQNSAKSDSRSLVYRLMENRLLKPGEIHYFDYPTFGVITLITPIS